MSIQAERQLQTGQQQNKWRRTVSLGKKLIAETVITGLLLVNFAGCATAGNNAKAKTPKLKEETKIEQINRTAQKKNNRSKQSGDSLFEIARATETKNGNLIMATIRNNEETIKIYVNGRFSHEIELGKSLESPIINLIKRKIEFGVMGCDAVVVIDITDTNYGLHIIQRLFGGSANITGVDTEVSTTAAISLEQSPRNCNWTAIFRDGGKTATLIFTESGTILLDTTSQLTGKF